jgi:predicted NBD/HSP70 family sugar kinase
MRSAMPSGGAPIALRGLAKSEGTVANRLLRRGPASQAELVASAGLSRPTVLAALTKLAREGLAEIVPGQDSGSQDSGSQDSGSQDSGSSAAGRRPHRYRLTAKAGIAIGVDVGRRHINIVVMDAGHRRIVDQENEVIADADNDPPAVLKQAVDLVHRALEEASTDSAVLGIAFGLAMPITRAGLAGAGTLLPAWAEIDPRHELARHIPDCPVYVGNESDLGALGEYLFGWGEGKRDLTYVKLGTGIGGGIVLGGRLQRGSSGTAAEIGHITLDHQGRRCPCGNRGCLERYAGGRALLDGARRDGLEIDDLPSLVRRARSGDVACRRILHEAGMMIGTAIGTLVNLTGPELVVLGGSLSAAGDILTGPVRIALDQTALAPAASAVSIELARLGRWASACGAVAFVFEHEGRRPPRTSPVSGKGHRTPARP